MVNSAHLTGKNAAEFLPPTGGVFEVSRTQVIPGVTCQVPCMSIAYHLKENHPGQLFTIFGSKGHRNDLVYACDGPEAPAGLLKKRQPSKLHKELHITLVNTTEHDVSLSFVVEELPATSKHMRERRAKDGPSRVDVCHGRDTRVKVTEPIVLQPGCISNEIFLHPQFVCKTTFRLLMVVDGLTRHSWTFNVASANTQQKEGELSLPTQRIPRIFRLTPNGTAPSSHTLLNIFDRDATYPFLMSVPTHLMEVEDSDTSGDEFHSGSPPPLPVLSPESLSSESCGSPVSPVELSPPPANSFGSSLASLNAACMGASIGMQLGSRSALGKRKRCAEQDGEEVPAKRLAVGDVTPEAACSPTLSSSTSSLGAADSDEGFNDPFFQELAAAFGLTDDMSVEVDMRDQLFA